ncbi:hypothetical protein, partial [Streptomyces wuyuanensis]|uniref:hypothetical protein n=1 Tax=Streptomyces wuyuanensis TaxID=1196353 RepID=UPI003441BE0C
QAINIMRARHVDFMPTAELAPALGITETDPTERGKFLAKLHGVSAGKGAKGTRGYRLTDLTTAEMSGS